MTEFLWDLFLTTGSPEAYVAYKQESIEEEIQHTD